MPTVATNVTPELKEQIEKDAARLDISMAQWQKDAFAAKLNPTVAADNTSSGLKVSSLTETGKTEGETVPYNPVWGDPKPTPAVEIPVKTETEVPPSQTAT